MYKCLLIMLGSLLSLGMKAQIGGNAMLIKNKSPFDFEETVARIQTVLRQKEIPAFTLFDHSKNAKEVGLNLNPNTVIVFGSPKVGTLLMQKNPELSIELPLKISIWQDSDGNVWTAFPNMDRVAKEYNLSEDPILEKMQSLLRDIIRKSINQ